jgi:hypothetical protein
MRFILELEIESERILSEEELAEGRASLVSDECFLPGQRGRVVDLRVRALEGEGDDRG